MADPILRSPFQGTNRFVSFPISAGDAQAHDMIFDSNETEDKQGDPLLKEMKVVLASKIAGRDFQAFKENYLQPGVEVSDFTQSFSNGRKLIIRKVSPGTDTFLGVWVDGELDGEVQLYGGEFVLTGDTGNRSGITTDSLGDTPLEATAVTSAGTKTIGSNLIYAALSDIISLLACMEGDLTWDADDIGATNFASVIV